MATLDLPPEPASAEPFGQTGVLQYAGRLLAWGFLCVGLCAAAMTHRSLSFGDFYDWNGAGKTLRVISSNGQISVMSMPNNRPQASGWSSNSGYGRGRRINSIPWQSSIGETLGVEARSDLPWRDADSGFWLRIKWPTIAVLFLIQPMFYFLTRIVRRRPAAV
ncbi:MAG: hypothetical protein QM754_03080 [Tepidisphaeraceae bacterium]